MAGQKTITSFSPETIPPTPPTLRELYLGPDDSFIGFHTNFWKAQTFLATTTYLVFSVKLKLWRFGAPGLFTVSIRATDGALKPTGPDLCVGTINGNLLSDANPGLWYAIPFTTRPALISGIKYAIVIRALEGNALNDIRVRYDSSAPTYLNGTICQSINSGLTWTLLPSSDMVFEVWG